MAESATIPFLVGTYTPPAGNGEGILVMELDTGTGSLRRLGATQVPNPSFVAPSPTHASAYAVSETDIGKREEAGSVYSLTLEGGTPIVTGSVEVGSRGPAHVAVSPDGRHVVVSNYAGGAVSVVSVADDGRLASLTDVVQHTGHGPDPARQEGPHVHSATFDPGGERLLVCDLGLDLVRVYTLDATGGRLTAIPDLEIRTPPGTGPRHLAFAPDGRTLFIAGELASTLLVYAYEPATGRSELLQVVDTVGQAAPPPRNYPADVHVHPGGNFVYLSNRGLDAIAVFRVDPGAREVTLLGNDPSGGAWPRNFALDPSGRLLLAANQRSDVIVPYWIDLTTGRLQPAGSPLDVGAPSCIRFLPAW